MMLIDGKKVAADLKQEMAAELAELREKTGKSPGLSIVIIGEEPSSLVYVRNKAKTCKELGIDTTLIELPSASTAGELLGRIDALNADPSVHGILVQLPLPGHLDELEVTMAVDPRKDVDGFHPENLGMLMLGHLDRCHVSCTPLGILELLARHGIETGGRHCVVVGRSNIVGKPLANLLMLKREGSDCTVTVCHTSTCGLEGFTRQADILVVAAGAPRFVTETMVKPGAVVVDVGNTMVEDATARSGYRFVGDVDFERVAPVASAITPVPGGVGPMTITMLMRNTINAFRRANGV
jgi:methylenetetrahydrofolate dehydrogenase (NADP+)/methenyltetrahydrofolate cyclohydrolase